MKRKGRANPQLTDDSPTEIEGFSVVSKIGEGGFGVVYKARHLATNVRVALKMIRLKKKNEGLPSTAIREIALLKELRHTNIIRFLEVVYSGKNTYLAFEYMDMDLKKHMDTCPDFAKDHRLIKMYLHQLLQGIAFCHSHRVIHRDLKPQNLLIKRRTNTLKIADFGIARALVIPVRSLTDKVATLWYRSPEVLFGALQYSTPIDIWSIGCIFAEMVNQQILFRGDTEIDQLFKIFRITGSPNEDCWPGVTSLPDFRPIFPKWPSKDLTEVVPNLEAAGHDLLSKMLQLDPKKRITARQALEHEYFKDVGSD